MPQHVLYITVDSIRADRMGYLGYDRTTTPRLDDLAAEGTVWTRAMASGIPTYFSFKSLLGGIRPLSRSFTPGLPADVTTLAEAFRQRGYRTAGFNAGNPWLTRSEGYARGFDAYRDFLTDDPGGTSFTETLHDLQRLVPDSDLVRNWAGRLARTGCAVTGRVPLEPAETVTEAATTWLAEDADPDRPTFLWIHYMDPHYPWVPPQDLLERFHDERLSRFDLGRLWHAVSYLHGPEAEGSLSERDRDAIDALYDAEVRRTDDAIGDLLAAFDDALDLSETLVAVVGDHGTELADHGNFSHAPTSLYDEVVRVPLLLRGPTVPSSTREEPVSLVDLPPTLLDRADPSPALHDRADSSPTLLDHADQSPTGDHDSSVATVGPDVREDTNSIPDSFEGTGLFETTDAPTITNVTYGFDPSTAGDGGEEMLTACVDWPWKLVDREGTANSELYDLAADPGEREDLSTRRPEVEADLRQTIEDHRSWVRRRQRTVAEKHRVHERVDHLRQQGAI